MTIPQPASPASAPRLSSRLRARGVPGARPAVIVLLLGLATVLCAATLPRDLLWGVESACILNARTTGAAFPCVEVNLDRGVERGYAVLRAPLRQTHLVAMPTARVLGVEAAALREADAPDYFADAWAARRDLRPGGKRAPGWDEVGLAVNSRSTRSQDQLHIHVDCVRPRVKAALAERVASTPTDRWLEAGYTFQGQTYWTRRVDKASLDGVNPFRLSSEIPALRERPALTVLAAIGVTAAEGGNGFLLLAGQSDPTLGARQSTSEDLLDHGCHVLR